VTLDSSLSVEPRAWSETQRRAVCGGCKVDGYLRLMGGAWRCPDCGWRAPRVNARKPRPHLRTIDGAEALRLYRDEELSFFEVAERLGTCISAARKAVLRAGGQPRPRGRNITPQTRTECHRGHPYTPDNTYFNPDGRKECRTCLRARWRRRHERVRRERGAADA
jgi:hypothetical protein